MRLYNATSCTPCCSTWEQAPPKRNTQSHSFVPTTSTISQDTDVKERINPPLHVHKNNNNARGYPASSKPFDRGHLDGRNIGRVFGKDKIHKHKEASISSQQSKSSEENAHVNSKFQYLSKIASGTTTTTGVEALLCANTSPGSCTRGKENITEEKSNERMGLFHQADYKVYSFSNILKSGKAIHLRNNGRLAQMQKTKNDGIHDYYYGRFLAGGKGGDLAHANDDDDNDSAEGITEEIESTSSTLTTTKSMILQQQEECAVTVNSFCYSKGSTSENGCDAENEVSSFARNHLLPGVSVKIGHKVQNKTKNNMKKQGVETQVSNAGEHTNCGPNKRANLTGAISEGTKELTHAKVLGNSLVEKGGPCRMWIPAKKCERTDGDDFVAAKARLRKISFTSTSVTELEPERVEFFPSQRQISLQIEGPPRLGATSKFPSLPRRSIPDISNDEQWDAFLDTDSERSKEEERLFWVDFNSSLVQDPDALVPVSSHGSDESPFPFDTMDPANYEHCDSSANALLEDKSDKGKSALGDFVTVEPATAPATKHSQDPKRYRDIRKLVKGVGQQRSLPRPHFVQQKPLLGPLLEARFTRSHWRRLQQKTGDDAPQKGTMDFDGFHDRRDSPRNCSYQPVCNLGFQQKESFDFVAFPEDASRQC